MLQVAICDDDRAALERTLDKVYAAGYPDSMIIQEFIPGDDSFMRVLTCYSGQRGRLERMCLGHVLLEGIGDFKGQKAEISFQNENLAAVVNGEIRATVPDLICLVDTETFTPVTTEALKYGKRVLVVGLKCYEMWRTPKGLELVCPRYFGVDTDYIPLEERVKGGAV